MYLAPERGSVRHLPVAPEGTYGPLCGMRPNRDWTLVFDHDPRWRLPLCSRCLNELSKLNEAAQAAEYVEPT